MTSSDRVMTFLVPTACLFLVGLAWLLMRSPAETSAEAQPGLSIACEDYLEWAIDNAAEAFQRRRPIEIEVSYLPAKEIAALSSDAAARFDLLLRGPLSLEEESAPPLDATLSETLDKTELAEEFLAFLDGPVGRNILRQTALQREIARGGGETPTPPTSTP